MWAMAAHGHLVRGATRAHAQRVADGPGGPETPLIPRVRSGHSPAGAYPRILAEERNTAPEDVRSSLRPGSYARREYALIELGDQWADLLPPGGDNREN
jgi:hypothetical protein